MKNKNEKYKVQKKSRHVTLHIVDNDKQNLSCNSPSPTDPLGSYTGVPEDPYEKPVQDADDL